MPLIMGILAQGEAAAPAAADSYDLLETEILTGSQASVTFSSLNSTYGSTYQHLQIRMTSRTTRATGSESNVVLYINGDTGSNYARHALIGNGSSVTSGGIGSASNVFFGTTAQATTASNIFGGHVVDILDPFNSSKNTTVRALGGFATTRIGLQSVLWTNTAAVTSLEIMAEPTNDFVSGTRISLYGLKAA